MKIKKKEVIEEKDERVIRRIDALDKKVGVMEVDEDER